jgi:hypothetical protein
MMQVATFSQLRKPTQWNRFGEILEGLSGSTLERGMYEEKHTGTWEALLVPG